jgi:BlaI family transcriptional regulator, penicillinase repressor
MKAARIKPTDKEMEVLQILWQKSQASVKEVHEELGGESTNGYTTILKIMQIMHDKGLVTREKNGKLHLYKAMSSPENTRTQLLDKMINTVFQGSASKMVMSALGSSNPSKEELKEIRNYLDQLEGGTK